MFQRQSRSNPIMVWLLMLALIAQSLAVSAAPFACSQDLNGDGALDAPGEMLDCGQSASGLLCPIGATDCQAGVCPLGNFPCVDAGQGPQCSANLCFDLASSPLTSVEGPSLDGYVDDGDRDALGNCLGATLIFSGRPRTCQPPGKSNGFKNCCHHSSDSIYFDSTGSAVENAMTSKALVTAAKAAEAAYVAYEAAVSSGATTAQAAQAGANAATELFSAAFDPASLAVAIAVAVIVSYLGQPCPEHDLETALLNRSGYCLYLGEYCKTEWAIGGCVQKEQAYCCFNSKLARLIQEQGRPQIAGIGGFGDAQQPDCRGFLPEEFQALDFSKIDLSEYYQDLRHDTQDVIHDQIQAGADAFYQNRVR